MLDKSNTFYLCQPLNFESLKSEFVRWESVIHFAQHKIQNYTIFSKMNNFIRSYKNNDKKNLKIKIYQLQIGTNLH